MRRREFLAGLSVATVWAAAARAEQAKKMPTIGFLGAATPEAWSRWRKAFVQRLGELGWIEGKTVAIEYRWAEGRTERYADIASEFVRANVDVIFTVGSAAQKAMQTTSVIPIVFAIAPDPVGTGLVASLSRPGGNVTGVSSQAADLAAKRLEILREVLPELRKVVVLFDANNPVLIIEFHDVQTTAGRLGLDVVTIGIRQADDLRPGTFEAAVGRSSALYAVSDPFILANRARVMVLANGARLPSIHAFREYVEAGGLMSYGPNYASLFARAGDFVDKILRGTKAGDLPVEQPTKFELAINLNTARVLGITIPPTILARADEVIE
jgi:putative tryptophan/tyrosine transport system substrate-binding protein